MSLSIAAITFDCNDAAALAGFWSEVFESPIDPEANSAFASINRDAAAVGPSMLFIQVPEGKAAKNRMHLDLQAADRQAEVDRLVKFGATLIHDKDEWDVRWTTLADPEGNEFCVATH